MSIKIIDMFFYAITFFLVCLSSCAKAQEFPSDFWNKGMAVTYKKDTLYGKIRYNFQDNSIQINVNNQLLILTSKTLLFFNTNDAFYEREREFFVIPIDENSYSVPRLFEVIYKGPLTLLAREEIVNVFVSSGLYAPQVVQPVLKHYYYILDDKGGVFYVTKKKHLIGYFKGFEKEMGDYIKQQKIKIEHLKDLKKLVHYYNLTFYKKDE